MARFSNRLELTEEQFGSWIKDILEQFMGKRVIENPILEYFLDKLDMWLFLQLGLKLNNIDFSQEELQDGFNSLPIVFLKD